MEYDFEKLTVWKNAMDLTAEIYKETKNFPLDEKHGLTSQLRRAASSIPANIAEGKGRYFTKEYVRFLYVARGSCYEVITFLKLAQELGYTNSHDAERLLKSSSEVAGGLNGLVNALK